MKPKILFFIVLSILISCKNFNKEKTNSSQKTTIVQTHDVVDVKGIINCDTVEILNNFKNILLNKQVSQISGYDNIPIYLIDFYKNEEPEFTTNSLVDEHFFRENYYFIFPNDILKELSVVNSDDFKNNGEVMISNIQSTNFTNDVKYDLKINYSIDEIKFYIMYKFPNDDVSLDSETAIIYYFKIQECKNVVIDKIIMAG